MRKPWRSQIRVHSPKSDWRDNGANPGSVSAVFPRTSHGVWDPKFEGRRWVLSRGMDDVEEGGRRGEVAVSNLSSLPTARFASRGLADLFGIYSAECSPSAPFLCACDDSKANTSTPSRSSSFVSLSGTRYLGVIHFIMSLLYHVADTRAQRSRGLSFHEGPPTPSITHDLQTSHVYVS